MLDELPLEILTLIAHLLPISSLRALGLVSFRFYSALVPEIYRDLTLCARSEWALNILDIESFFLRHGSSRASSYLQYTKNLHIEAPIHLARFNRCAYYSIFRTAGLPQCSSKVGASDDATAHEHFLDDITDQLQLVFARLKPNSLRAFRWRLGICIPMGVLDQGGYLSQHQKSLSRLSLVTDGTCPQAWSHLDGLSELSCLKELEWEGIQHPAEVDSLQQCIRQNWSHLTSLSIGFVSSSNARTLCWDILGLRWPNPTFWGGATALPPLSTLLLSKVTLPSSLSPGGSSIFLNLRTLKLRDCPNQLRLLESLSRCQKPVQLEQFEACFDFQLHDPVDDHDFSGFVDFLLSFHGLKHLYLRLSNVPRSESRIPNAIRHHQPTLETFIYHERQLAPLDDDGLFEESRDVTPAWIPHLSIIIDPYKVTALALAATPSAAKLCLRSASTHSQLQLLHLRFSGPERIHRNIRREILACLSERQMGSPHVDYLSHCDNASALLSSTECEYDSLFDDYSESLPGDDTVAQHATMDCSASHTEAEEFLSFAEWVFGPCGIPSLQVLAFGDFSHEERYREQQFLIRRVDPARARGRNGADRCFGDTDRGGPLFEPAVETNVWTWDALSIDGPQFLSACPGGGLMESPYEM
ncbi:hypothetical protein DTO013E5_9205 [Penicillium roqueforti]|nr:hypothetical protein DTO012A1_8741 [Penicillium roqueforti]KAI2738922.1 hypothetical protein DTO013F2_9476 [Penicillium roqueforti]KAI2765997.1 hypothetical protein DTO012A8_8788 [Penicillium roqueforti]KAI3199934.1 hypothetical protein DTO013E5_9205 [Penicillium roqueforti]